MFETGRLSQLVIVMLHRRKNCHEFLTFLKTLIYRSVSTRVVSNMLRSYAILMVIGISRTLFPTTPVSPSNSLCLLLFQVAFPQLSDQNFLHPPTPLQSIRCRFGSIAKSSFRCAERHPSTVSSSVSATTSLNRNQARPPRQHI